MRARIRRAQPADAAFMAAIDRAVSASPWSARQFLKACSEGAEFALVAQSTDTGTAGDILGFLIYQQIVDEVSIHNVAVAPAAQRRGIARALIEHMLQQRPDTTRRCLLEVRASNNPALALYRHLGFVEDGRRRGYYPALDGREDAVLMSLELTGSEK